MSPQRMENNMWESSCWMRNFSMRVSGARPLIPVRHSLRPALSGGNCEESEQSPDDVVIVKLLSLPVSSLHLLLVLPIVNVVTPGGEGTTQKVVTKIQQLHQLQCLVLGRQGAKAVVYLRQTTTPKKE